MNERGFRQNKARKKMKKKDRKNFWGRFFVTTILLLFVILIVVPQISGPHFRITKEECFMKVNQTIYDNCVAEYDDNWNIEGTSYTTKITPNLKDGLILFEFSENSSLSSLNIGGKIIESKNCINVTLLYEDCEQVEVEDNVIDWCYDKDDCGKIRIGEKSWGIEWLDENCECIDWCRKRFEQIQCPLNKNVRIERDYKCSKYSCGDYIVETWNQIK